MKLSVIIPCLNATGTLTEQLEALESQDFKGEWEVIVADNGSNDHPEDLIARFQARIPGLRLIDAAARRGPSFARNTGASSATGDALLFCDADDVVSPGWLQNMHDALQDNGFVTGPADTTGINDFVHSTRRRTTARVWYYMPFLPHAVSGNMGVRKDLHTAIGGFDEDLLAGEDIDYSWRMKLHNNVDVSFVPDAPIFYRLRPTLWSAFKQNVRNGRYTVKLFKKYRTAGHIPPKSLKEGLQEWRSLARDLPQLRKPETRARWVRQFGQTIGRLIGSIRERVLAL